MRKTEIFFNQTVFTQMKAHLLQDDHREFSGFLLAGKMETNDLLRLLVREFIPVDAQSYTRQSGAYLKVKKEFLIKLLQRVEKEKLNLIEAHSHPFSNGPVNFSGIDLSGQKASYPYVAEKIPEICHANLVMGKNYCNANVWNKMNRSIEKISEIKILGQSSESINLDGKAEGEEEIERDRYSRQIAALGEKGQSTLGKIKIGIVGVGGIGWNLALQLAHLGIRRFVLVDKDKIEMSNLNRLIGATVGDVGRHKVMALKERLKKINAEATVTIVKKKVGEDKSLDELRKADVLIGCVDNWGTRTLLNSFSIQYLVPYFDVGTEIRVENDKIVSIATHCLTIIPGFTPCFECLGIIDKRKAAEDLLPPQERKIQIKRGYVKGAEVVAPAVLPLNNVILSLTAWEFLSYLTGFKIFQPFIHYDGLNNEIKTRTLEIKKGCVACDATYSNFAMGDHAPLPRAYFEKANNVPKGDKS